MGSCGLVSADGWQATSGPGLEACRHLRSATSRAGGAKTRTAQPQLVAVWAAVIGRPCTLGLPIAHGMDRRASILATCTRLGVISTILGARRIVAQLIQIPRF